MLAEALPDTILVLFRHNRELLVDRIPEDAAQLVMLGVDEFDFWAVVFDVALEGIDAQESFVAAVTWKCGAGAQSRTVGEDLFAGVTPEFNRVQCTLLKDFELYFGEGAWAIVRALVREALSAPKPFTARTFGRVLHEFITEGAHVICEL